MIESRRLSGYGDKHLTSLKTLIVITGPTGIGKTDLSISIAESLHCPIVSADSRQIYKGIPVGTAAPTEEEMARVRHYFVGILEPTEYYSAAQYEAESMKLFDRLFLTHDTLVMTGGSMLYIDAVCRGIDDIPTVDSVTRGILQQRLETEGLETLAEELSRLDPRYYAGCDRKNPKRIVHALEVCLMTGRPFSSFLTGEKKARPFRILRIGLEREREDLFSRISERVEQMVQNGLVEETRSVWDFRHCNALNTVGYKEMFAYLDGEMSLEETKEKIKRNTRVYAKKQMTWFKKDASTFWFLATKTEEIRKFIAEQVCINR